MPNLAGVLKDEIRRLARKEIRAELATTKKASAQYRKDIAALKRQLREQAREITALERAAEKAGRPGTTGDGRAVRFSPRWLRSHRERLELSAADYAALLGVSAQTVYNWEQGKARPRTRQLEAWSAIRELSKREAWRRLERMA